MLISEVVMDQRDRPRRLRFEACEVGFVFREELPMQQGMLGRSWAFGSAVEAATWLVEQYGSTVPTGEARR